jgi:hypothetical protein
LPDVDRAWGTWWSLDTVGRAIAAAQHISCLMYPENENPVFAPWTPNGVGGPPCLWEFEGHLYTHRWLEPNIAFLKKALNVPRVTEDFSRAVDRLVDHSEHEVAARIREGLSLLTDPLQARCVESFRGCLRLLKNQAGRVRGHNTPSYSYAFWFGVFGVCLRSKLVLFMRKGRNSCNRRGHRSRQYPCAFRTYC